MLNDMSTFQQQQQQQKWWTCIFSGFISKVVRVTLTSSQGTADIEIWWNGNHFVEIAWPSTFQGLANGLCGIPDGDVTNDHQNNLGQNVRCYYISPLLNPKFLMPTFCTPKIKRVKWFLSLPSVHVKQTLWFSLKCHNRTLSRCNGHKMGKESFQFSDVLCHWML